MGRRRSVRREECVRGAVEASLDDAFKFAPFYGVTHLEH